MSLSSGDRISAYRAAYRAANGKDIEVYFDGGWFRVGGRQAAKWRGKKLDDCAAVLRERAASVDTHAKRGDSTQIEAPSPMGSAVVATSDETPND